MYLMPTLLSAAVIPAPAHGFVPRGELRLPHELWLFPRSEQGHFWRATLPSALAYADAAFS